MTKAPKIIIYKQQVLNASAVDDYSVKQVLWADPELRAMFSRLEKLIESKLVITSELTGRELKPEIKIENWDGLLYLSLK